MIMKYSDMINIMLLHQRNEESFPIDKEITTVTCDHGCLQFETRRKLESSRKFTIKYGFYPSAYDGKFTNVKIEIGGEGDNRPAEMLTRSFNDQLILKTHDDGARQKYVTLTDFMDDKELGVIYLKRKD